MTTKYRAGDCGALFGVGIVVVAVMVSPVLIGRLLGHFMGAMIAFSLGVVLLALVVRLALAPSTRLICIGLVVIFILMGTAELMTRSDDDMKRDSRSVGRSVDTSPSNPGPVSVAPYP